MLFDNYSALPCYIAHHAFYDHSCVNCRTLYNLYGHPQCTCSFHRIFCIGSKCDIYESISIKHEYIQLSLFD